MSDGGFPDVSRIVSLIMENPKLIEEISALAKSDGVKGDAPVQKEETPTEVQEASVSIAPKPQGRSAPRAQLLCALKPYISKERAGAIDSMISISEILDTICSVIEKTPPELVGDILKNGIVLAGGGSMLYGIDKLIEDVTGIKTRVAKSPMLCVANGMIEVLGLMDEFSEQRVDLSKIKQKI